jgi:hypothetical protein
MTIHKKERGRCLENLTYGNPYTYRDSNLVPPSQPEYRRRRANPSSATRLSILTCAGLLLPSQNPIQWVSELKTVWLMKAAL